MAPTDTLQEVKWEIRSAIRQSSLNAVNRSNFHIFICNWSSRPQGPCTVCEDIRDLFREEERNAFVPSDLDAFFTSNGESPSRDAFFRKIARTSSVIFILYNAESATDEVGQAAKVVLSEISADLPSHIRNRVRPLTFHQEKRVDLPNMPGKWSTTQPRYTDRETLFKRVRMIEDSIRRNEPVSPGERWYDQPD